MEKDIEILEKFIKMKINSYAMQFVDIPYPRLQQAIENLINRVKELEVCLEAEEKYAEGLNRDIKSLLNIEPNNNFISKSKIKEKIKEYTELVNDFEEYWSKDPRKFKKEKCVDYYKIEALQELLKE